jgi:iron(II)-dependent oxidoreductase
VAGGHKPRRYAWGQTFTVELANTLEGRVLALSPVGAYPTGAAACGALDMSGNGWEWTHSLYRQSPDQIDDGREDHSATDRRVLRGGAWSSEAQHARVSYRGVNHPDNVNGYAGLRVIVAPALPSSGS